MRRSSTFAVLLLAIVAALSLAGVQERAAAEGPYGWGSAGSDQAPKPIPGRPPVWPPWAFPPGPPFPPGGAWPPVGGPICEPPLITPHPFATLDNGRTDHQDVMTWSFDWGECRKAQLYQLRVSNPNMPGFGLDFTLEETEHTAQFSGIVIPDQALSGWTWAVRAKLHGEWGDWNERAFNVEPANTDPPYTGSRRLRVQKIVNTPLHPDITFAGPLSHAAGSWSAYLPTGAQLSAAQAFAVPDGLAVGVAESPLPPFWQQAGYAIVPDPDGTARCSLKLSYGVGNILPADGNDYLVCVRNDFLGRLVRVQKVTPTEQHPGGTFNGVGGGHPVYLPPNAHVGPATSFATSVSSP